MMNGIRSDFTVDRMGHGAEIKYKRKGGIFITKQEICLLVALVCVLALIAGMIGRYSANKNCRVATRQAANAHRREIEEFNLARAATARLDSAVIPIHYTVEVRPVEVAGVLGHSNFTWDGSVKILLNVQKSVNHIKLYSKGLFFKQESIGIKVIADAMGNNVTNEYLGVSSIEQSIEKDIVKFHLNSTLKMKYKYELSISFSGRINDNPRGLFSISYPDLATKHPKWMLATRFDPIYTRLAIPSFDEPKFKATFEVHVLRPIGARSISNTKEASTAFSDVPGYVWDKFSTTPKMSTNSLGFFVFDSLSDYNCDTPSDYKQEIDIWSRGNVDCNFTITEAAKLVNYLEKFLGVTCPLDKIDIIITPKFPEMNSDIWGILVLTEQDITREVLNATLKSQEIRFTLAEKLVHQWFGTLVTTSLWQDSWINEAAANYISYYAVESIEPEWGLMEKFHIDTLHRALRLDSVNRTSVPLNETMLSTTSYDRLDPLASTKGACLLRMLDLILPDKVFQEGIKSYLSKWQYNVTDLDYFWSSIQNQLNASNVNSIFPKDKTIKDIMQPWIVTTGYPVVTVRRDYFMNDVIFSQEKFSLLPENKSSNTWNIPITFTRGTKANFSELQPKLWLVEGQKEITQPSNLKPDEWLLVNLNQAGFFRVNYDKNNWELLTQNLPKFPETTQSQLINDAFALAQAGLLNYTTAFDLSNQLTHEKNYMTWVTFLTNINFIKAFIEDTVTYEPFQEYLKKLIVPNYKELSQPPKSILPNTAIILRSKLTYWACLLEVPECVNKSIEDFNTWMKSPKVNESILIEPDYQDTVLCTALRSSTSAARQTNWKFLWERFLITKLPSERTKILKNLLCTPEPRIIRMMLEKTFNGEDLLPDDIQEMWKSVSLRYHTIDVAFDYIREKWDFIFERTNKTGNSMQELIMTSVTKGLSTELHLRDLLEFQETYIANFTDSVAIIVQDSIEDVKYKTTWRSKHLSVLQDWLNKNK